MTSSGMTFGSPQATPTPDGWAFATQIVEDAQQALGVPYIILARFDRKARTSRPVAIAGMHLLNTQSALRISQRLFPRFDMYASHPVDANPIVKAVFDGDGPIINTTAAFTRGLLPSFIAGIASRVAGAGHCLTMPLSVDGQVMGCLSFYQATPDFTDAQIRVAQAFTRQASLSIHNAELLLEAQRNAAALDAARRLVSDAEERTRRDISEFLHSHVQSRLLVAELRLDSIRDVAPAVRERINAVRIELETLREQDVRRASHQLHPEALRVGLVAALQLLAEELQGALTIHLMAEQAVIAAERTLPMSTRLIAFRVVEEAIGNVLKHAVTPQATVTLRLEPPHLCLHVTDNGRGFTPETCPPGLGLLSLGARVESAGGRWGLDSQPGGPTRVWAEIPA